MIRVEFVNCAHISAASLFSCPSALFIEQTRSVGARCCTLRYLSLGYLDVSFDLAHDNKLVMVLNSYYPRSPNMSLHARADMVETSGRGRCRSHGRSSLISEPLSPYVAES